LAHAPIQVERRGRLRDDVARITQVLANELESLIRKAPEQWHLLQPNWPSDFAELPRSRPKAQPNGRQRGQTG
jgi:KDO2-lipid IV(A) lauroyltransferase